MFFLLNHRVLDLRSAELSLAAAAHRYRRLNLEAVSDLGAEVFAQSPLLPLHEPARALALASMIVAVAPRINAAQFIVPAEGCAPEAVERRFERAPLTLLDELRGLQRAGRPTSWVADRRLWRRLAA